MNPAHKRIALSFSFGNHLKSDGGTDKVISEHQQLLNTQGVSYIQIAPVGKNAQKQRFRCYTVVVDGGFDQIMAEEEIMNYLDHLSQSGYRFCSLFIHHLKKLKESFLLSIFKATKAPVVFYLHDYYSVCTQYNLLKNGNTYCGKGKPSAAKCAGCSFYAGWTSIEQKTIRLLKSVQERLIVVSPSQSALEIWLQTFPMFRDQSVVLPHQKPQGLYTKLNENTASIKVAFIGKKIHSKGGDFWDRFIDLVSKENLKYRCYYLGVSENPYDIVEKVSVNVTPKHLDAMIEALRKIKIQIILLWSIWPETYSYTFYEALSANCFVITNQDSGNICAEVTALGNGRVFSNEEDALSFLSNPDKVEHALRTYWDTQPAGPKAWVPNPELLTLVSEESWPFTWNGDVHTLPMWKARALTVLYRQKYSMG